MYSVYPAKTLGELITLLLFRAPHRESGSNELKSEEAENKTRGVRCPLCRWRPLRGDRWMCLDCGHPENFFAGCGTAWNTFETGGVCPGCSYNWKWTSCLRCTKWSRHEEWYE